MTRTYAAVLAAVLLVLAGCSGAVPGGPSDDGDGTAGGTGTVNFYVSDEPNAIEDFEHLNVTITKVGFHRAKAGDDAPEPTATGTESTATGTESTATGTESTATETESTATGTTEQTEGSEDRGDWEEFDVDSETVDLTELQGNNATLIGQFDLDNGTYDKVFVYISDVNGTLKTGETVNVKLPSERLHVNKRFTIGANESVDFVYDITVFKAGKSGKYILKPVVSESGTEVPIDAVGESDDDGDDGREGTIEARFVGKVEPGANATVKVTRKGQPIENATVIVNGTEYTTGSDGTVTFPVPENATELEVIVEYEDEEVELNREFKDRGRSDDNGGNDDGQTTATPTPTPTPTPTATAS